MAAALGRLELGESMLFERAGQGISSFPIVSIAPHALSLALFGAYGFLVADLLIYLAYYFAVVGLLRIARIPTLLRNAVALVLVCGGANFQYLLAKLGPSWSWDFFRSWDLMFWVWGERFPRPFVSELFLLAALAAALWLIQSRRNLSRPRNWALAGLATGA